MRTARKTEYGFTLIELLVVIAIIAILAAILFPVYARVVDQAKQTTCLNNIKQLALSVKMYVADFDGRYPPNRSADGWSTWFVVMSPSNDPTTIELQGGLLKSYYMSMYQGGNYVGTDAANSALMICPSWQKDRAPGTGWPAFSEYLSYGTNDSIGGHHESEIGLPTAFVMFAEIANSYIVAYPYPAYRPAYRHGPNKFGAAFVDGHAKMVNRSEYWAADNASWNYWNLTLKPAP